MPSEEVRALLGWMDQQEAIAIQLGGVLPLQGQDVAAVVDRYQAARAQVAAREPYSTPTPVLAPLPQQLQARAEAFLQRPDIVAAFQGWEISVGMADLRSVLSFQKIVTADGAQRVATINPNDPDALFSFCLPDAAGAVQLPVSVDADGKGFSMSSPNPNFRVLGGQPAVINGQAFFGFAVGFGNNFVQVVEYQRRWFIRDGYHRCYGLLRTGVAVIPCLFIRARDDQQFGGTNPAFFGGATLFGSRPPFLVDFLDDRVSHTAQKPVAGKVIRIAAQEFAIQL